MEINLTDLRDEVLNTILEEAKLIKYFNNNKPIPVEKFKNYLINEEESFIIRKDKKHFKKDTLWPIFVILYSRLTLFLWSMIA